jgi:murein DD-endopeptidase MepM/ murein hydrolase activator NlpD
MRALRSVKGHVQVPRVLFIDQVFDGCAIGPSVLPSSLVLGALMAFLAGTHVAVAQAKAGGAVRLSVPIACKLGESCFIQNYVDVDPGHGVRDYMCGSATSQDHTGTDFRLNSAAQSKMGVGVLAAAEGTVKRVRDGMADVFANAASTKALKGRECGNGIVIDHGDGWETQYCHMLQGSLAVRTGDRVARGQRLGDVGYSGKAQFAHLHFSVRYYGETIDPFLGRSQDTACASHARKAEGLWEEITAKLLEYQSGQVFAVSFSDDVPALDALERNHVRAKPHKKSGKLILLARFLNLREGDRIRLAVNGPAQFHVKRISTPLERHKATYMAYVGKRRTSPSWPPGRYEGHAQILRGDVVISEMRSVFALPD